MFQMVEQIPLADYGKQGQFQLVQREREEFFRSGGFDVPECLKHRTGDPDENLRGRIFDKRRIVFDQRPALFAEDAA